MNNASDYNLTNLHIDVGAHMTRNPPGNSKPFSQHKKSQQAPQLRVKRDVSQSKYAGKQIIDSYVTAMFPENKKRKSAHPSMLDNLASRGNLPILSLQELDKMP